jgi:hypothetical protein
MIMKRFFLCCFFLPMLAADPLPEVVDRPLLMEVTTYLYRWVLDEKDVEPVIEEGELVYWLRELSPELDEGDASRMLEVWMPQFSLQITLRKADYRIPEMNLAVKNNQFKITNVLRGNPPAASEGFIVIRIPYAEVEAYAFERRAHAVFPEGAFLEALRETARNQLIAEYKERGEVPPSGSQQVFFAPLSPVANDLWIFWETGGKLLRFSSDLDLEDPALWKKEGLTLRSFDLRKQTVVHLNEVKGSNAYMTRDQVGRYLFNCIVLGKKVLLRPPAPVE